MWLDLFLATDIPIYKDNNAQLKSLFSFLCRPLSLESSLYVHIASIADFEAFKVHNFISGKKIFLVIDESDVSGKRIFNTLVSTIDIPAKLVVLMSIIKCCSFGS